MATSLNLVRGKGANGRTAARIRGPVVLDDGLLRARLLGPGGNADVWGFAVVVRLFVAVVGVGDAHAPAHQFAHCIDGLNQHPPVDRPDLTRPPEVPGIGPQAYDELTHHVDPPLRIHPAMGVLVRVRVRPIVSPRALRDVHLRST